MWEDIKEAIYLIAAVSTITASIIQIVDSFKKKK